MKVRQVPQRGTNCAAEISDVDGQLGGGGVD